MLIVGVLVSLIAAVLYCFRLTVVKGIHCPPMHPLLGHIPFLKANFARLWDAEVPIVNACGGTYQLVQPGRNVNIRTVNPANIKHMLSDNFDNYCKNFPGQANVAEEFFGNGIFAADGADAKAQRKTASHMFSTRVLRDHMERSFLDHGQQLCDVLAKVPAGTVVDMQDYVLRFTMDSFSRIAFGVNLNSLNEPNRPAFAWAFDRIQELLKVRQLYPEVVWRTQRFFQTAREAEIRKCQKILHAFVKDVIQEREGHADLSDEKKWSDLMSRFVSQAKKNNESMDRDKLRDVILNFMIAGRDTTGCLLTWALVELHQHPEWEEKCLSEIREVLGSETPSHDNVQKLTTMQMFLSEVLRLHPPVPSDGKRAIKADVWPDGTQVPAGANCSYLPYAAGRWEGNWGADALEFKPERWENLPFETTEDKKDFDFKFITFNAGPRICLGKSMAYMEAKMCLAQLLPKFRFRLVEGADLSYKISIILQLLHGLPMTVSPRDE